MSDWRQNGLGSKSSDHKNYEILRAKKLEELVEQAEKRTTESNDDHAGAPQGEKEEGMHSPEHTSSPRVGLRITSGASESLRRLDTSLDRTMISLGPR